MNQQLGHFTLVTGFFMPILVSLVVQCHWPKWLKTLVAMLLCVAAATAYLFLQGKLHSEDWVATVLWVCALSITFFKGFWKPLGVANSLEKCTSLKPSSLRP